MHVVGIRDYLYLVSTVSHYVMTDISGGDESSYCVVTYCAVITNNYTGIGIPWVHTAAEGQDKLPCMVKGG